MRILVVEDEPKVALALKEGLEREGYDVIVARTGEEGYDLLNAQSFELVILDLMLPGHDGLDVLRTLRARGHASPVLVLTARDTVEVGAKRDGVIRHHKKRREGTVRDTVMYSILASEWPDVKRHLQLRLARRGSPAR